ncbi:MAG TPA: hypothetical protein VHG91_01780, partial [Longimicrobium sp.]|nr:hypothetical protein [Longimicrobium sp.]
MHEPRQSLIVRSAVRRAAALAALLLSTTATSAAAQRAALMSAVPVLGRERAEAAAPRAERGLL